MIINCYDENGTVKKTYSGSPELVDRIQALNPDLSLDVDSSEFILVGMNINEYDKTTKELKPLSQRIADGYVTVKPGFKVVNDKMIEKTLKEKIDDGDITLEDDEIYDENIQEVREKTSREMYDTGKMIEAEYLIILKQEKLREILKRLNDVITMGYIDSTSLGIRVDFRHSKNKRDQEIVKSLIAKMDRDSLLSIEFKGLTESKVVSREDLVNLEIEMQERSLELYNKKFDLDKAINDATTVVEVDAVEINFN